MKKPQRLDLSKMFEVGKVVEEVAVTAGKVSKRKTVSDPVTVQQKEWENLQAVNNRAFLSNGIKTESGDALKVASRYEKLVNRQEKQLAIYEREHGKPMTNQDIEGIEQRVTKQIELMTGLYEQGRIDEYSMRFGSETLAQAKQYGRNTQKENKMEGNVRGTIQTVSLSTVEDVTEDIDALEGMMEQIDNSFLNSLLVSSMSGEDYLFCIDYLADKISKNSTNCMKLSRIITKQKESMQRYNRSKDQRREQGESERLWTVKAGVGKVKDATIVTVEDLQIRAKRKAESTKPKAINLSKLAKMVKAGKYTATR